MEPFAYAAAASADTAIARAAGRGAEFIAGGTDMLQLLQERVRAPAELIDINELPLRGIERQGDHIRIGALTRMAELADHPEIRTHFPAVAEALLASASGQVRNMASIGGNLLQRTRCLYFRDVATPCNKRQPGSGCPAQDGHNRLNAILGGSSQCIATHASDLAVALVAFGAEVELQDARGTRRLALDALYRLPGDTPHIETVLEPGELITAVLLPVCDAARRSAYLKIRDRGSFEWAVVSVAAGLALEGDRIKEARIAVGGVATKPWRLPEIEAALRGRSVDAALFRAVAARAGDGAVLRAGNGFKLALMRRAVARALEQIGEAG
jgi:xanthine dehydrogenase YagS FAD-binding subunit